MMSDRKSLIELHDIAVLVRRDQAAATVGSMGIALSSNILVAFVTMLILWTHLPPAFLAGWMACIVAVTAARYGTMQWARRSGAVETDPEGVLRASWLGALAAGMIWSALSVASDTAIAAHTSMLLFVLSGLVAGAVALNPGHLPTSSAYAFPVLAATIVGRLAAGDSESLLFAFAAVFFTVMLGRSAVQAQDNFRKGSRTKHAATALSEALRTANAETVAKATMLQVLASRDALTGLPNRLAFAAHLEASLAAGRGGRLSLLLLDLDHFKLINDTLGHGAGDGVLVEVAARLRDGLGEGCFPARLGGDEFAVVLDGGGAPEEVARQILAAVSLPLVVGARTTTLGASIGIACCPADGATAEELMVRADLALYAAKGSGRQRFCRFDAALQEAVQIRRDIELDLPRALADRTVEVWCQPQVALSDLSLVGIELLIRWKHERHGWIPPADIVAAARSTHQSEALTMHVVAQACRLIRHLRETGHGHVTVAVNVSPQELGAYPLAARIAACLAAEAVSAQNLEIEITEEAAIAGAAATREIEALADLGIQIALDDFGAGYASLASLKTLRLNRIKIDRGFVVDMAAREGDRVLVRAILGIGRAFGLDVVAEGVESAEDARLLAGYGCHVAQGYHFARPMPRAELDAWMSRRAAPPPRALTAVA